jgi:hypothetical protein
VGALALHSTIDYVLHFPWLVVMGAALVGTAIGAPEKYTERTDLGGNER